jgi:hypothetical protein
MGISRDNIITNGLSGKAGEYVFRQLNGKTVVSKMPVFLRRATASQLEARSSFKDAVAYAKNTLLDIETKRAYKAKAKPGQSAFNRVIIDFLKPPVIEEIDCTHYNGQPGSRILINTWDDFSIVSVHVKIENRDGSLLEESAAMPAPVGFQWVYIVNVLANDFSGNTITVTVMGMPGHAVIAQKTI